MTTKKAGIFQNRANVDTTSVDAEKRTFEVVFATETPVFRRGWDEDYNEVLSVEKGAIRSGRLESGGMALIDDHNRWGGIGSQMGRVVSYTLDEGKKEARAVIQFSTQEKFAGIFDDIKEGIIRNISVGYRVWKYERSKTNPDDRKETPVYRATDWEPQEISLTAIPADYNSSVRTAAGNDENDIEITNYINRSNMEVSNSNAAVPVTENTNGGEPTRAAAPAVTPAPVAAASAPAGDETERAVTAERERGISIRTAVEKAKLPGEFATDLINRKDGNNKPLTLDAAKAAILDRQAELQDTNVGGGGAASARGQDIRDTNIPMVEALMERSMPGSVAKYYDLDTATKGRGLSEAAKDFRYMSLVGVCRAVLQRNGINDKHLSDQEVATRAMNTTDMPDLFTSTVKRFLRMYYEPIVPEWAQFSRRVPANDFRVKTGIKVDMAVTFEELAQNGEYKASNLITDEKATLQLKTYARKFSVTRQTIINDDLSVLQRVPQMIGIGARQFQSKKVWALITGNATCPDGVALFHATHKNLGTAALIADKSLSAGRTAMRRQLSPEGNELMITPRYLMVPPELETTAQKFLRQIYPTTVEAVNLWQSLDPLVNVYFSDTKAWFMAADPASMTADGIVHAYLDGQEGLFTESYIDKNTDSLVIKARQDFDCAMWGWQGWFKNPGLVGPSVD